MGVCLKKYPSISLAGEKGMGGRGECTSGRWQKRGKGHWNLCIA